VSADAVEVARANAARLALPVQFVVGDLLAGPGDFDAVVANLPYVSDGDALPRDVIGFEPAGALFGGPDGLDVVRGLVAQLGAVGWVALEVGAGQAPAVASMLEAAGFARTSRIRDLAGIERVVVGCR
jgi:release factor glutamine methyltransferase